MRLTTAFVFLATCIVLVILMDMLQIFFETCKSIAVDEDIRYIATSAVGAATLYVNVAIGSDCLVGPAILVVYNVIRWLIQHRLLSSKVALLSIHASHSFAILLLPINF